MRSILSASYAVFFRFSRSKAISYWLGLAYVSLLILYAADGFTKLTTGWLSFMSSLRILFRFPVSIGTFALIGFLLFRFGPNMRTVGKEAKTNKNYLNLLVITALAILMFVYLKYGDKILM